jgi:hypothetical protein
MTTTRASARVAGVLLLCATAASLIDRALIAPILGSADYLAATAGNSDRVVAGAFFQVATGLTSAAIALAMYPVVARYAAGLAIGSVGFRLIEGTFYLVGGLGALLVVSLAHQVTSGGPEAAAAPWGQVLLDLRDRSSQIGILAFYVGGTLYYLAFLRHRLIPRWLSVWGLVSTALGFASAVLVFCGAIGLFSALQVASNLPIFLNEIVLAIWLLAVGFTEPATCEPPATHAAAARGVEIGAGVR